MKRTEMQSIHRDTHTGWFLFLGTLILITLIVGARFTNDTMTTPHDGPTAEAIFAGGCFWCMEKSFEKLDGVVDVVSGYIGGEEANPTYEQVSSGTTNHREAVKVIYDQSRTSYEALLEHYWVNIDPFNDKGQFCDTGKQYTPAIFYLTDEQGDMARHSLQMAEAVLGRTVMTEIVKADTFYEAEDYHQDYYKKNPIQYTIYETACQRDKTLNTLWGDKTLNIVPTPESAQDTFIKPSDEELKKQLTPIQYKVTQEEGTERPFANEYHDLKEEGIYVDIVSGEPLFSSTHKYDSGTGWPSFTQPISRENIKTESDYSLLIPRTEVRSKKADSHLGHLFNDGPGPSGERFCMNSAALRFIPKDKMQEEGYGEYLYLFEEE